LLEMSKPEEVKEDVIEDAEYEEVSDEGVEE
jgi:hypothetical protein